MAPAIRSRQSEALLGIPTLSAAGRCKGGEGVVGTWPHSDSCPAQASLFGADKSTTPPHLVPPMRSAHPPHAKARGTCHMQERLNHASCMMYRLVLRFNSVLFLPLDWLCFVKTKTNATYTHTHTHVETFCLRHFYCSFAPSALRLHSDLTPHILHILRSEILRSSCATCYPSFSG